MPNIPITFKFSSRADIDRELNNIRRQLQQFQRDVKIDFGFAQQMLGGSAVTPGTKRSALAELSYLRQAGASEYKDRITNQGADPVLTRAKMQGLAQTIQRAQRMAPFVDERSAGGLTREHWISQAARGLTGISVIGSFGYAAGSALRKAGSEEYDRQLTIDNEMRRMVPQGSNLQRFTDFTRRGGVPYGMAPEEFTKFTQTMGQVAGREGTGERTVSQAAQLSRAFALTPQAGAQIFGAEARSGVSSERDQRRFAEIIAQAISRGRFQGREGEVFDSIMKASESIADHLGIGGDANALLGVQSNMAALLEKLPASLTHGPGGPAAGMQTLMGMQSAVSGVSLFPGTDFLKPAVMTVLGRKTGGDPEKMLELQQTLLTGGVPGGSQKEINDNLKDTVQNVKDLINFYGTNTSAGRFATTEMFMQMGLSPSKSKELLAGFNSASTPEQQFDAVGKVIREWQSSFTEAQKTQIKEAEFRSAMLKVGERLIPTIGDIADMMIKLTPLLMHFADAVVFATHALAHPIDTFLNANKKIEDRDKAERELTEIRRAKNPKLSFKANEEPMTPDEASDLFDRLRSEGTDAETAKTLVNDVAGRKKGVKGLVTAYFDDAFGIPRPTPITDRLNVKMGSKFAATPSAIDALGWAESELNPNSPDSPTGARGEFQMLPSTARDRGIDPETLRDPAVSRREGTRYFNEILNKFGGDTDEAVLHYHDGPNHVGPPSAAAVAELAKFKRYLAKHGGASIEPVGSPPSVIVGGDGGAAVPIKKPIVSRDYEKFKNATDPTGPILDAIKNAATPSAKSDDLVPSDEIHKRSSFNSPWEFIKKTFIHDAVKAVEDHENERLKKKKAAPDIMPPTSITPDVTPPIKTTAPPDVFPPSSVSSRDSNVRAASFTSGSDGIPDYIEGRIYIVDTSGAREGMLQAHRRPHGSVSKEATHKI